MLKSIKLAVTIAIHVAIAVKLRFVRRRYRK